MIRKADIILGIVLIITGLAATWFFAGSNSSGSTVHVIADGKSYGYYSLAEDQDVEIRQNDNINKINISDGSVSMSFSSCPNQDCVKHSAISDTSETIVCLPNKIVIEIDGSDSEFDAISK